jgi:hypothetical protein
MRPKDRLALVGMFTSSGTGLGLLAAVGLGGAGPGCKDVELLVFRAHEKFDAEGRLIEEPTREHLGRFMTAFRAWIPRFR